MFWNSTYSSFKFEEKTVKETINKEEKKTLCYGQYSFYLDILRVELVLYLFKIFRVFLWLKPKQKKQESILAISCKCYKWMSFTFDMKTKAKA